MAETLLTLERNNIPGALKVAREAIGHGEYESDVAQSLLMLQDDPAELIEVLDDLLKERGSW